MAQAFLRNAFRYLLYRIQQEAGGDVADGQLLDRFCTDHDQNAFTELVRRHAPMVLGACRRVLHDVHEAEDACQATFLVLARKAASVHRGRSLGSWLYTVAHNLAVNARISAVRRKARESEAATMAGKSASDVPAGDELRDVLDAELSRLPTKYRTPLILCYLEGKTHEAAAQALGWPAGSMAKRLSRAKELLRARLTRRGVEVSLVLLTAYLTESARAEVPLPLVEQISSAATAFAAGGAAGATISARTAAYAEGMLHTMMLTKCKLLALVTVLLALVGTGIGVLAQHIILGDAESNKSLTSADTPPPPKGLPAGNGDLIAATADGEPLPAGALARLGAIRFRHDEQVLAVAFSPDGKTVATACGKRLIHLWDRATGRKIKHWQGCQPLAPQPQFNISTESAQLDDQTDKEQQLSDPFRRKDEPLRGPVKAKPATNKDKTTDKKDDVGTITRLAFSPDGRLLAATQSQHSTDQQTWKVKLWDLAAGKPLREIQGKRLEHPFATFATFSPDGKILLTDNSSSAGFACWDVATGKELYSITTPAAAHVYSADGRFLAVLALREAESPQHGVVLDVFIHDGLSGKVLTKYTTKAAGFVESEVNARFSPDGRLLAVTGGSPTIHFLETLTGKERRRVRLPASNAVVELFSSADGRYLAALCWDQSSSLAEYDASYVRLWDWATGEPDKVLLVQDELGIQDLNDTVHSLGVARTVPFNGGPSYPHVSRTCAASAPDRNIIAVGGWRIGLRFWDMNTGQRLHQDEGHQWPVSAVAYSPDGKLLATGGADRLIKIWDVASRKLRRQLLGHSLPVTFLAFSGDGQRLFSGARGESTYSVWDMKNEQTTRPTTIPLASPTDAALLAQAFVHSAQHQRLAILALRPVNVVDGVPTAFSTGVLIFDENEGVQKLPMLGKSGFSQSHIAYSVHHNMLAVASYQKQHSQTPNSQVTLYDARSGKEMFVFEVVGRIETMQFMPDGKTLAINHNLSWMSGLVDPSQDSYLVSLWDVTNGKLRTQLDGHEGPILALAAAPDGKLLATVSADKTVCLWEPATGKLRSCMRGHFDSALTAAFSPDGQMLATGSLDNTVLLWNVPELLERKGTLGLKLEQCWADLASKDGTVVDRAIRELCARPHEAVSYLSKHARPLSLDAAGRQRLQTALADLQGNDFALREKAAADLERLGEIAEQTLRDLLESNPPLEIQRRVSQLLEKQQAAISSGEALQVLRVIEVLERIGTPEARGVLEQLAKGAGEARRTREAQATLQRLIIRPALTP